MPPKGRPARPVVPLADEHTLREAAEAAQGLLPGKRPRTAEVLPVRLGVPSAVEFEDPIWSGEVRSHQSREVSINTEWPIHKESRLRFNWVTPDGCGTYTTDPNKMQVLPRRMEDSQNTCDVCGHACTQVLYEFRCYPKLDKLTEQERHTGVRMLDPFVAYIGKTCGQGLLGCRTSTSVIREWIRRDLLSKPLEEAEQLILALEQAERLATMNELRKQAGFEGPGKMQRKESMPRPLGAPGEMMVGLRDKEDLKISVDPPPGTSLQDHVLKTLLGITWPDCVSRGNVIPDGQPSIKAFCLGATQPRFRRELSLAVSSRRMPRLTALVCRLAREIPEEGFPWTSVQANRDYAARFHRDKNNLGPSWIIAFGDFSDGGELFIADEGQFDQEEGGVDHEIILGEKVPSGYVPGQVVKGKLFDIRNRWQRFDGRHGHMAMPFRSGTRISLVFFTRREAFDRMPDELAEVLTGMGFRMPDNRWFDQTREPAHGRPLKQLRRLEPEPAPEPDTSDDEAEDASDALEGQPIKDLERFPSEMKVDWSSLKLSVGVVSCNAGLAAAMAMQQLLPAGTTKASVVDDSDAMLRWAKNFKATQGFKDYKVLEQGKAMCHVQNKKDERLMADEHIFHGSFEILDLLPYFQLEEKPHLRGLGDDSSVSAKAFRAIQGHLKQKPPVVLLEVPDWDRCPQQGAMKFLSTNLLSYDYYHGRCVKMDLPEPLSGSSRLIIFLVRKDIMSGQKLLQTVQLAKYLLRKLPPRQVELPETIGLPEHLEKPPIGASVKKDGVYRTHLLAQQPDHWLLEEPWSKYLKRLNQVCKQARTENVDWSRILVDLGEEQTIWSDDGQLPNASSPWHYSLAKHRLLRGDEELLCRGYPCEMALLRHLTDDQRRHLAARSSSSVQLLGACLAALLGMSDWMSFSPALQALSFQGELPDLSEISCEEPICSELNEEDESQVIQNRAVLCYSLLQRLVEPKPKSKGKKSILDKAVQSAMKERVQEMKNSKGSQEEEADSLMRCFDDEIVDLVDRKRKLTYYFQRTGGCLPFDHAMSWTFQAAIEEHDNKDVAQEVINAGLLYMHECISLVIHEDAKQRKHANKLDKSLTGLDKYHAEFFKGLESKSRAWPENLREAFLNFKRCCLVRFFLRGDFAQKPIEEYVANIMPVTVTSGIGKALMKVLEDVSKCWGDEEWAAKFRRCGGLTALAQVLVKVAEAEEKVHPVKVQKKIQNMLQKFSSDDELKKTHGFLRAALQLASGMKGENFFKELEVATVDLCIELLQKPNAEETILFLKDLQRPRFQWTAEFLRVLEDVKRDLAAVRMDEAEIEKLHELLNRLRSTTAQRPTEAREIWKSLSSVEDSLGTTVEEDLQTRLKVAEEKQRQEREAQSFARRQEKRQRTRQQAQGAFANLRSFLVFEEYPGGERKPRLLDFNEPYLRAQEACVELMRCFQTEHDLGGLREEEQEILDQSKEAFKAYAEAPAVEQRQKSVLLESSMPLCLVEILDKVGLLPRLPELTAGLLDDHRFLPGGVKATLLRCVQEGHFNAEKLKPQLPGGWTKRISKTYDLEYVCLSDEQRQFLWPRQELPGEHQPWPHEPRRLQRHSEESAKYLLPYGSGEHWCYLCNTSFGAPKEHLRLPQHVQMRQEWLAGCGALKKYCEDLQEARLEEACAARPSLAEDILKLWRYEAVQRLKGCLTNVLPAFWHLILEPWEDSRSVYDLQRWLEGQLQGALLEEPARVPEPELPQPGRDFPDFSSGNLFLNGNCLCCNESVSDNDRATHSQSKIHDKNLKASLYAFDIIKEHGDRLWRDGMRFEAGKVKCACTKEVNWWEIGSWFADPPHIKTKNHEKWLRNTEDPPPTERMPWEDARRQRWLASFAPVAPEADPAEPATPEPKRRRTEGGEPEAERDEAKASGPSCKSMARAAEFALEPPTAAEIETGITECCHKRHFPELPEPLCYGWSSFKKTKKEAWLFCKTCSVWVGVANLTVSPERWTYRLDSAEDASGACEHYSSVQMRDHFAKHR